jgi:hypothetical protein
MIGQTEKQLFLVKESVKDRLRLVLGVELD